MDCTVCGSREFRNLYRLGNGDIRACRHCRCVSRQNLIGGADALRLYDDDSYLDSPYFEALKVGGRTDQEPYHVYRQTLDRLEGLTSKGRLLDVGCSYGAFLDLARQRGWEAFGTDISAKAGAYAVSQRGLPVFRGTVEQARYPSNHFTAVTLWDVIEHLDRPLDTLREIRRILAPGGVVVLFTINQKSLLNRVGDLLYRLSRGRWLKPLELLYDIHHNFFFDRRTLSALLRRSGLDGQPQIDWMDANIERWQTVPIPRLLALGCQGLDLAARLTGMRYRMVVYGTKPQTAAASLSLAA